MHACIVFGIGGMLHMEHPVVPGSAPRVKGLILFDDQPRGDGGMTIATETTMNESRAVLAGHSAMVCGPDGQPVLRCPADWTGPPVARYVTPADAECGPQCTTVPTLFAGRSGTGRRRYRSGARVLDLSTGPQIDMYGAGYERDHARWSGTGGDSVCVRLPAEVAQRLLHDEAAAFDLQTRYEVVDEFLAHTVLTLADEIEFGFPNGRMHAEGLCLSLLGRLSLNYSTTVRRALKAGLMSERQRQRVRDLIEARLGEHLSLQELAESVGLSPYHFARLFKASFGEPPHRYVLRRRIEQALASLKSDHDRPIADIAIALGFVSQAHLTDAFRRHTGMTPARWRTS
jgi:AraC family transcriptional regulator